MLILAEKPSVAEDFARFLHCTKKQGYYEGDRVIITYCVGHLYRLFEPKEYDAQFATWRLEDLPINPEKFRYATIEKTKKQAEIVTRLLKCNVNDTIILATDADREGEVIGRLALYMAGITPGANVKRFWVSQALTDDVIAHGLRDCKPLSEYQPLFEQGKVRQQSDWLVGINLTRCLSLQAKHLLSIGRVQTAVAMAIYDRNKAIHSFTASTYYEYEGVIKGSCSIFKGTFFTTTEKGEKVIRFPDTALRTTLQSLVGKKVSVVRTEEVERREETESLYNLTALQKDAHKVYGLSPAETLSHAQALYEKYKCLSYPRTPSRVMGNENYSLVKDVFLTLSRQYAKCSRVADMANVISTNTHIFDSSRLESHHALIPLNIIPGSASEREKQIYFLVVTRFFLAFAQQYRYVLQTVILSIEGYSLVLSGRKILQEGWHQYAQKETDTYQDLSGETWKTSALASVVCKEKQTKPPKHFTIDSLLSFMENPRNSTETKSLIGLGTPATRHVILETLFQRDYITVQKKNILMTEAGNYLIAQILANPCISSIASIEQTTLWEEKLASSPATFLLEIRSFIESSCAKVHISEFFSKQTALCPCPLCGKGSVLEGKQAFYCSEHESGCRFILRKTIAGVTLSRDECIKLLLGKMTRTRTFKKRNGIKFKSRLRLSKDLALEFC